MDKTKNKKILMVEDDEAQSLMYQIEFNNFGFDFVIVSAGENALAKIKKEQPDLVLLDLLIGKASGSDILKEMKANDKTKNIKAVIISNYNKKGLSEECLKAGALDFWVKSDYVPRQIVGKVQALLKNITT